MKKIAMWIKTLLTVVTTMASICVVSAQSSSSTLIFDQTEWDFGNILEVDGKVSHTFSFTNAGENTIAIERVKVDCGCTTPKYDTSPIAPGDKGTIEVTFDPNRFSGTITKRVTVYSNAGVNRNLLTIKGSVVSRPRTIDESFPFELGNGLRAEILHRGFGYIENSTVESMTIEVMNTNPINIVLSVSNSMSGNEVFVVSAPDSIPANGTATITLTYDLTNTKDTYGMLSDRVYLSANGLEAQMPLSANVIAVDHFPVKYRAKVQECRITPTYHNFGEVAPDSDLSKEITITNKGQSTLIVRDVSLGANIKSCSLKAGTQIKAGKTLNFDVTMNTNTYGSIAGGVMIIVNDPSRPLWEVRLAADLY